MSATLKEIGPASNDLIVAINGNKIADIMERLAVVAYESPRVSVESVANDPAQAMYQAIRDIQNTVQYVLDDLIDALRKPGSVESWKSIVDDLRKHVH